MAQGTAIMEMQTIIIVAMGRGVVTDIAFVMVLAMDR